MTIPDYKYTGVFCDDDGNGCVAAGETLEELKDEICAAWVNDELPTDWSASGTINLNGAYVVYCSFTGQHTQDGRPRAQMQVCGKIGETVTTLFKGNVDFLAMVANFTECKEKKGA